MKRRRKIVLKKKKGKDKTKSRPVAEEPPPPVEELDAESRETLDLGPEDLPAEAAVAEDFAPIGATAGLGEETAEAAGAVPEFAEFPDEAPLDLPDIGGELPAEGESTDGFASAADEVANLVAEAAPAEAAVEEVAAVEADAAEAVVAEAAVEAEAEALPAAEEAVAEALPEEAAEAPVEEAAAVADLAEAEEAAVDAEAEAADQEAADVIAEAIAAVPDAGDAEAPAADDAAAFAAELAAAAGPDEAQVQADDFFGPVTEAEEPAEAPLAVPEAPDGDDSDLSGIEEPVTAAVSRGEGTDDHSDGDLTTAGRGREDTGLHAVGEESQDQPTLDLPDGEDVFAGLDDMLPEVSAPADGDAALADMSPLESRETIVEPAGAADEDEGADLAAAAAQLGPVTLEKEPEADEGDPNCSLVFQRAEGEEVDEQALVRLISELRGVPESMARKLANFELIVALKNVSRRKAEAGLKMFERFNLAGEIRERAQQR